MTMTINGTSGLVFNDASTQNTAATGFGFKNRIINGAMMISQSANGASVTNTGSSSVGFAVDRFTTLGTQNTKLTMQQNAGAVTPPVGFTNYLGVTTTTAYSVTSSDWFVTQQRIEGFNVADLGWGTANAATVTLSFWVRSSLTGTFGGALQNSARTRSYPFSYTISAANTWEQKSITIAGDTTGTWLTDNGIGIQLIFGLGIGSTFSGTAGSWSGSDFRSATGATSVVGTSGATFYITGVQLEKGSTATSFDYRPYGTELALCQRYYQQNKAALVIANQTTSISGMIPLLVQLRAEPTLGKTSGTFKFGDMVGYAGTSTNTPIIATQINNNLQVSFSLEGFSGMTVFRTFKHEVEPSFTALFTMSAEL
jgi:hypothetical protein